MGKWSCSRSIKKEQDLKSKFIVKGLKRESVKGRKRKKEKIECVIGRYLCWDASSVFVCEIERERDRD